jgi:hypothetical protein
MLGLGTVLFLLHRAVAPPPSREIVVSAAMVEALRQDHTRRLGVRPSPDEERALIARFVGDEVLYREALRLGLDRGDVIVRRRLVQKMEFLAEEDVPAAEPSDADLARQLAAHPARYDQPARVSLRHVFAGSQRHGTEAESLARAWRTALEHGADPLALGDPFLRGHELMAQSERELGAIFGAEFAARVVDAPVDRWVGPLRSSYGFHVVRLFARTPARTPAIDDIREVLRSDWLEEQRAAGRQAAVEALRRGYVVRVEGVAAPETSQVLR